MLPEENGDDAIDAVKRSHLRSPIEKNLRGHADSNREEDGRFVESSSNPKILDDPSLPREGADPRGFTRDHHLGARRLEFFPDEAQSERSGGAGDAQSAGMACRVHGCSSGRSRCGPAECLVEQCGR